MLQGKLTERQAFVLLAEEYGPGYNGPLLAATRCAPLAKPSQAYEEKTTRPRRTRPTWKPSRSGLTAESRLKPEQASLEREQAQLLAEKGELQQGAGAAARRAGGPPPRGWAEPQAGAGFLLRSATAGAGRSREVQQLQAPTRQLDQCSVHNGSRAVALRAARSGPTCGAGRAAARAGKGHGPHPAADQAGGAGLRHGAAVGGAPGTPGVRLAAARPSCRLPRGRWRLRRRSWSCCSGRPRRAGPRGGEGQAAGGRAFRQAAQPARQAAPAAPAGPLLATEGCCAGAGR